MDYFRKTVRNIIIFMVMALCIIVPNVSSAKTVSCEEIKSGKSIGKNVLLSLQDLHERSDLYCVQWQSRLRYYDVTYVVSKYVKIVGNEATDDKGNTSKTKLNGRLAYIIAKGDEFYKSIGGKDPNAGTTAYAPQQAMWATINSWYRNSGKKLGNFDHSWTYNNNWNDSTVNSQAKKIMDDAKQYALDLGSKTDQKVENKTNKDKITVKNTQVNGEEYTRIGPFKYTFAGKMKTLSAKDQDGNDIKSIKIGVIEGNTQKFIKTSEITSNKNFYIYTSKSANVSKITKLKGSVSIPSKVYTAELWFLTCKDHQNLLLVKPGTENKKDVLDFEDDYDITTTVDLTIKKVDEDDKKTPLKDVEFIIYNKDMKKYVRQENGKTTYVSEKEKATSFKTGEDGKFTVSNLQSGTYLAYEISNPNEGYVVSEEPIEIKIGTTKNVTKTITNKKTFGKLGIKKVDKDDNTIPLKDVEFIIYNKDISKYVHKSESGEITYVDNESDATIYVTDENGIIEQDNLLIGNYLIYEKKNPNEGYQVNADPTPLKVGSNLVEYQLVTNEIKYVNISGYVWIDKPDEVKQSVRNDLYHDNDSDTADIRKSGVTVRLKDASGKVLMETKTNENGEYLFENVEIDTLETDYVEFVYDGLIYENVVVHTDKANGSKASEGSLRDEFNGKFARVDGKERDEVQVKDESGNSVYNVKYALDSENRSASIKESNCEITANTKNAGYTIKYDKSTGEGEVKNINLGLYEREQTDLALTQDLEQVKVSIKGDTHIYKYASRFNGGVPTADDWNVGVKFPTNRNNPTYLRPLYRADAEYQDASDPNNNIKIYLSYKIALGNQSSKFSRVNNISDYFDARYEFNGAGLGIDEKGNITDGLKTNVDTSKTYGNQYHKVDIETNTAVKPNEDPQYVYVQFILSRENILNLLNEAKQVDNNVQPNLKNLAEITSYTTYTDDTMSKYYAAVDKDSVVDNVVVEDETTYEDDTRTAPNVGLVIANARVASGVVFEDNADENLLKTQNIRQGDGKYDSSKESTIGGVTVELMEVDSNGNITDNVAKVYDENANDGQGGWTEARLSGTTTEDGKYSFRGFVPGSYAIRYTWGDGIYKFVNGQMEKYQNVVQNYKATVIEESRYNQEISDPFYYNKLNGQALSHGIDNWALRQQIDTQLNSHSSGTNNGYNYATDVSTTKMVSWTPMMTFKIEYEDTELNGVTIRVPKQVTFDVDNINFGIIRRPVQSISVEKRISHVTVKYTSGDILIDADIDENGKLTGQTNYLTYVKPTVSNGKRVNGFLRAELDSEVVQNSSLEITYRFTAKNNSEADYASQGFYNFGNGYYSSRGQAGETQKEKDVVTISPSKMIDYLDKELVFKVDDENNKKYGWTIKNLEDIKNGKYVTENVEKAIQNNTGVYEYYTEAMANTKLKPVRMIGNNLSDAETTGNIYMVAEKSLTPSEDINMYNQVEIVELNKTFGSRITSTPGNYEPNGSSYEDDDSTSEEMIITPSTGANKNYIIIGTVSIIALITLGAGTYFIRKFNKKQ